MYHIQNEHSYEITSDPTEHNDDKFKKISDEWPDGSKDRKSQISRNNQSQQRISENSTQYNSSANNAKQA